MLFDLNDLRLFIYVAELKSLTRSAERMHLSLAAASSRIKGLEARFGMRLLYREAKGVKLTAAGETLLRHALQMMQQFSLLKSDMQQYSDEIKGHMRIFANTTAVTEFMPAALGTFLRSHPNVNVSLEERLNNDIVRGIQDGAADIGIVAGPIQAQGLDIVNFSTDQLILAIATGHPLSKYETVLFSDTLQYAHIGLHEGSTLQHFLDRIVSESGQRLNLRIQVRSFEAMCRMIESDIGIGILPKSAAQRHKQALRIELVELNDPWAVRERSVVFQNTDTMPQYMRDLIDGICALPAY